MKATKAVIEPTAAQLEVLASLEAQAREAFATLDGIDNQLRKLWASGVGGGDYFDFGVDRDEARDSLEVLANLRITGGRPGFMQWLALRALGGHCLNQLAGEPESWTELEAVEKQILKTDPELVHALNRSCSEVYIHDDAEVEQRAGISREEVARRAEEAIGRIIASGWRP